MSLKVSCGVSKKVGLPNYGSLGASCHVEFEVYGSLLQTDLEAFQHHVKNAYVACTQAVGDELARQQPVASGSSAATRENGSRTGNGHRASQKQLDYANQLTCQINGFGVRQLETLSGRLHSRPIADLSSLEASSLIDTLKAIKDGRISLEAALNGSPS